MTGEEPDVAPTHAALFGLAKVIGAENDSLESRCIDVDDGTTAGEICRELLARDEPSMVAYRDGERYLAHLQPVELLRRSEKPASRANVHLITGGLGGLGLEVARYLSGTPGGVTLALVSRSVAPSDELDAASHEPGSKQANQLASLRQLRRPEHRCTATRAMCRAWRT